ncbi:MAG TPA: efflux RND transporter periplasmic adaptor subunit, partial [Pelolinea sp.]|nr:efflux RND transporter periplasmic adaptor subunit [Pelolinea sp.]
TKQAGAYKEYQDAVTAREKALRDLNNLLGTYYTYATDTDFILFDQADAAVEEARIDYNRAFDQSDEISAAKANVQALDNTINQSKIIAPFDGTVTEISAVPGDIVASGAVAVRLDNLENLIVNVSVSEVDINKVKSGQKAIITFDALPDKEYQGEVVSISSAGNDASGVVEFSVKVRLLDADESVKPGFTSVVSIITNQVTAALIVPNDAVISRNGNSMVMFAGSDGSLIPITVETGASSDTSTQIISGDIKEGDQLAIYSANSSGSFGGFNPGFGQMRFITGGSRPPDNNQRQQNNN